MNRDIAHVSFAGGSAFFPARTPYDRETLIEHVLDRVRTKGAVQVLLNEQRWMITSRPAVPPCTCRLCDRRSQFLCGEADNKPEEALLCLPCALDDTADLSGNQAVAA